jgi:WD40 repeat protein
MIRHFDTTPVRWSLFPLLAGSVLLLAGCTDKDSDFGANAAQVQLRVSAKERSTFKVQKWSWLAGVCLTADGNTLAAGGMEHVMHRMPSDTYVHCFKLWDVTTGKEKLSIPARIAQSAPVMDAEGKLLVSNDFGELRVWDGTTGKAVRTLEEQPSGVLKMALTVHGTTLATANFDTTISLYHVQTGRIRRSLAGHAGQVIALAFTTDGTLLASDGGEIKIWDVRKGREICTIRHPEPFPCYYGLAFSPDGRRLAAAAYSTDLDRVVVRFYEPRTGRELSTLMGPKANGNNSGGPLAFNPDGTALALACESGRDDCVIALWSLPGKAESVILRGHPRGIVSIAFSADGKTMVSASGDGMVKVWDVFTMPTDAD